MLRRSRTIVMKPLSSLFKLTNGVATLYISLSFAILILLNEKPKSPQCCCPIASDASPPPASSTSLAGMDLIKGYIMTPSAAMTIVFSSTLLFIQLMALLKEVKTVDILINLLRKILAWASFFMTLTVLSLVVAVSPSVVAMLCVYLGMLLVGSFCVALVKDAFDDAPVVVDEGLPTDSTAITMHQA